MDLTSTPSPTPGEDVAGSDPDEMHRLAVERREYRLGRGPQPAPNVAAPVGTSDGTWRSPGYRASRLRARIVIGLLATTVIADLAGVLAGLQGLGLMDAAENGTLGEAEAVAFDNLYATIGMVQTVVYVASAIAVLAWLSRVVENIPPLTGRIPRRSPREAIGWWFVPFANYVVPYQIVADSLRRLRVGDDDRTDRLLVPWWALWVVASVLGSLLLRLPQETIQDLRTMLWATLVSDTVTALAGILLVLIVRGVERHGEVRAAASGLGGSPVATWRRPAASMPFMAAERPSGVSASTIETLVADTDGPLEPPPPPGPVPPGPGVAPSVQNR